MKWYLNVLQNYANFSGRARRKEFWLFLLFHFLAIIAISFIGGLMHFYFLVVLYYLGTLIPYIALLVRRAHDSENSGWCMLIPFYNFFLLFVPGTQGENRYGLDPKQEEPTFDFEAS